MRVRTSPAARRNGLIRALAAVLLLATPVCVAGGQRATHAAGEIGVTHPRTGAPAGKPRPGKARRPAANGQNYRPRPAIWKIADADTTIYLFGTIHVLPPGFRWRSAGLERVIAQSDTLLLESLETDPTKGDLLLGAPTRGAPKLAPLVDRVSPERRQLLIAFQRTLPVEAAQLMDGMPTWVAAMAIDLVRDLRSGEELAPGADDWLEAHFRAAGKRVEAIEDPSKVVKEVNAIPEAEQRRMLDTALLAEPRTLAQLRQPAHAWAKGDMGPQSAVLVGFGVDGSPALQVPLITRRNAQWAARLAKRLRRPGTVLFAAGAGHFVGKDSVIELLEKHGLKVTRVE